MLIFFVYPPELIIPVQAPLGFPFWVFKDLVRCLDVSGSAFLSTLGSFAGLGPVQEISREAFW